MIFNTYWFVVFTAVFFPLYWLLRSHNLRRYLLLVACVIFHAHFAGPAGVLPIVVLGLVTYFAALSRKKAWCISAIVLCVTALCFYKYTLFFTQSLIGFVNPSWGELFTSKAHAVLPLLPPLAISFFVFEFVHYLIEVIRGHTPMRKSSDFALFAIYFPSLVAGPIKRYETFVRDLDLGLARVNVDDVAAGASRIALGLIKKVIIADNLTLIINFQQPQFDTLSPSSAWLIFAGISLRILLDFSGYSDMAIGLSRLMGIRLPENFNFPYLACSLQNFWQRWHISLSSWIRDYVYIPLGGNRHGPIRKMFNGLTAFALCGLWHGPSWQFIIWGLYHGVGLAINSSYASVLGAPGRGLQRLFTRVPALGLFLTLPFVCFGWLIFFYQPATAWRMAVKLLSFE